MKLVVTALITSIVTAASPARAEHGFVRGDAKCSDLIGMIDSGNRQEVGYAGQFVVDVMIKADDAYVQKKRGGIMAPLNDSGIAGVVAMAIVQCRNHPEIGVTAAALGVYAGLRSMNSSMGFVK